MINIFGHIALDYICFIEKFPNVNASSKIKKMGRFFGGGAANVSAIIASLGGNVKLFSAAGGDFISSGYSSHLTSLGVDISGVKVFEEELSAHAFIFNDSYGNQITFFYWGASDRITEIEIPSDLDFVHIATGNAEFNKKVANSSNFLSFDAGQDIYGYKREDILEILKFTNILFSNEHEIEFIKKECGMKEADILEIVDILVITYGEKGSKVVSSSEEIFVPSLKIRAIDPTGAGDAYKAGFLFALGSGLSLKECAEIGTVCASFVVESYGSQTKLPKWDEVEERRRKFFGEMK
jgi:ribokinase